MAHKVKDIYINRLLEIRNSLGYTQNEMAQILMVSERMICNYETGVHNLPIDKAMVLAKKYNYSLDWIYCNDNSREQSAFIHTGSSQLDKFVVDIRDFVSCVDNIINITIPENYWKYINELNSIVLSNRTDNEKARDKALLDGQYRVANRSDIVWRLSIPKDDISSYIQYDSVYYPFVDKTTNKEYEPSKEQHNAITAFFNNLNNENH